MTRPTDELLPFRSKNATQAAHYYRLLRSSNNWHYWAMLILWAQKRETAINGENVIFSITMDVGKLRVCITSENTTLALQFDTHVIEYWDSMIVPGLESIIGFC